MNTETILARYANRPSLGLTVGTVEDYVDSVDNLSWMTTLAGDIKDVQRPWALKQIVGNLPPGSRLCEIGGGEPFVADILQKMGYEVCVVDPYDGAGQGPTQFEAFRASYPNLRLERQLFGENVPGLEPASFDGIYSISVLEHIPLEELPGIGAGIHKYLRPKGYHCHAVDMVVSGAGDAYHFKMLGLVARAFGVSESDVRRTLVEAAASSETYFLSAEAHNRWRGSIPYKDFPMRKVISFNFSLVV